MLRGCELARERSLCGQQNILFGLAVVPMGIWILRKLSARLNERFLDELAGRNLTAASKVLADLARFEEDPVSGEV